VDIEKDIQYPNKKEVLTMTLKQYVDDIINLTNYAVSCHGLQAKDAALEIAKYYFKKENISFENWTIREIPLADNSNQYPVSIVLCVNNKIKRVEINLMLTRNGELFCICPDQLEEIELHTIKEAINHSTAKY
jgi:hypothetical protein